VSEAALVDIIEAYARELASEDSVDVMRAVPEIVAALDLAEAVASALTDLGRVRLSPWRRARAVVGAPAAATTAQLGQSLPPARARPDPTHICSMQQPTTRCGMTGPSKTASRPRRNIKCQRQWKQ
jgi:hypothetical protein